MELSIVSSLGMKKYGIISDGLPPDHYEYCGGGQGMLSWGRRRGSDGSNRIAALKRLKVQSSKDTES